MTRIRNKYLVLKHGGHSNLRRPASTKALASAAFQNFFGAFKSFRSFEIFRSFKFFQSSKIASELTKLFSELQKFSGAPKLFRRLTNFRSSKNFPELQVFSELPKFFRAPTIFWLCFVGFVDLADLAYQADLGLGSSWAKSSGLLLIVVSLYI